MLPNLSRLLHEAWKEGTYAAFQVLILEHVQHCTLFSRWVIYRSISNTFGNSRVFFSLNIQTSWKIQNKRQSLRVQLQLIPKLKLSLSNENIVYQAHAFLNYLYRSLENFELIGKTQNFHVAVQHLIIRTKTVHRYRVIAQLS